MFNSVNGSATRGSRLALGRWMTPIVLTLSLAGTATSAADSSATPGNDEETPTSGRLDRQLLQSIDDTEQTLRELVQSEGSFHLALLEPLSALSEMQYSARNLEAAERLLNRQLEIQRMNLGLYSAEQVPVLESLLRVYAETREWGDLRDTVANLAWLYERAPDMDPEQRIDGLMDLRDWLLVLFQEDRQEQESRHILSFRNLSDQMGEAVDARLDDDEARMTYKYEQAAADLLMAMTIIHNPMTGQDLISRTEGIRSEGLRPGQTVTSVSDLERAYGPRASTVAQRSFERHMRRYTQRMDELEQSARDNDDQEAQAMLLIYQGDSILIRQQFEQRVGRLAGPNRGRSSTGNAARYYRDAWELLIGLDYEPEQLSARFSCPALLPLTQLHTRLDDYPVCEQDESGRTILPSARLLGEKMPWIQADSLSGMIATSQQDRRSTTVNFTVAVNGQANRGEIVAAKPDKNAHRTSSMRLLRKLQFRPAIEEGKTVRRNDVELTFTLP